MANCKVALDENGPVIGRWDKDRIEQVTVSETKPFYKLNPLRNPLLFYGTIAAQGIHISAMHMPGLQEVLGVAPVTVSQWITSFSLALSVFIVGELHKWTKK